MTPLEINRKIAILKGFPDPYASPGKGAASTITNTAFLDMSKGEFVKGYKNWAESIADAWELFEDMVDSYGGLISVKMVGNSMPIPGWPKYKIVFDENDAHIRNKEFSGAETAPLSICLAWLAWKKQKDNEND